MLVTVFPAVAQPAKVYRIGVLSLTEFNKTTLGKVLIEPLATRGYILGQNIVFEERSAEGKVERLPVLAAELVQLKVDLIVAGPAVAIRAAHNATTTIPIVMAFSADDPVKSGFVTSLARPGGNVTGVTAQARDLAPKWMEFAPRRSTWNNTHRRPDKFCAAGTRGIRKDDAGGAAARFTAAAI